VTFSADFLRWLEVLEPAEGEHANDPDDAGGDTWYGVTVRDWPVILTVPIEQRREKAREIAWVEYWQTAKCDQPEIPWPLNVVLADWCFNSGDPEGPSVPEKALQRLIGVKPDGDIGRLTLTAVGAACGYSGPVVIARKLQEKRVRYLANLIQRKPSQVKFAEGWWVRTMRIDFLLA